MQHHLFRFVPADGILLTGFMFLSGLIYSNGLCHGVHLAALSGCLIMALIHGLPAVMRFSMEHKAFFIFNLISVLPLVIGVAGAFLHFKRGVPFFLPLAMCVLILAGIINRMVFIIIHKKRVSCHE